MIKKVYKIYNPETGLYHAEGSRETKTGKTWSTLGHVKTHLRNSHPKQWIQSEKRRQSEKEWALSLPPHEIIEYEIREDEQKRTKISSLWISEVSQTWKDILE